MYLKSLELQGFKSFPNYTQIDFHPGVTAIVGPNGSGKSNITDAVRWVLGEQSVRTLRGGAMEDVIFSGTAQRRAMSFCEVSITLINDDHALPIEYEEVQITRRLFRSGESEYLINKQNCRLKDIVNLFMDTGLGKDGYSIIGQGQIDSILSSKSDDRRKIFEEATGIQKFKSKRDEAIRKLTYTEQNLTRITDLLNELGAQLGPLERQAQKAKRFLALADELKVIEVAAILSRIDQNQEQLHQLEKLESATHSDLDRLLTEQGSLEKKRRQLQQQQQSLDLSLLEKRSRQAEVAESIAELRNRAGICAERERQLNDRLLQDQALSTATAEAMMRLQTELAAQTEVTEALEAQVAQEQGTQGHLAAQVEQATAAMKEATDRANLLETRLATLRADKESHQRELIRLSTRQEMSRLQLEQLAGRHVTAQDTLEKNEKLVAAAATQLSAVLQAAAGCADELQNQRAHVQELSSEIHRSEQELQAFRQEKNNAAYQLKTLQDLEASMAGYSEAVKALSKQVGSQPKLSAAIRGTVGALADVPAEYELAIETALGGAVQHIIVDTDQTAAELIGILKEKRLGRATFLPISTVKGNRLDEHTLLELRRYQGYIGLAADLVHFAPDLQGINEQLLGRVVIIDHLDHARIIAKQTRYRYRLITLAGEVMNIGGSLTGGYHRNRSSGLLRRNRSIAELQDKLPQIDRKIADTESDIGTLGGQLADVQADLQVLEERLAAYKETEIQQRAELQQLEKNHQDLIKQADQQQLDRLQLENELAQITGQIVKEEQQTDHTAELIEEQTTIRLQLEEEAAAASRTFDGLSADLAQINLALSAQKEKLSAARQVKERIAAELAERERADSDFHATVAAMQADLNQNRLLKEETAITLRQQEEELRSIHQSIADSEEEKRLLDREDEQNLYRDRQVRDQLARIETELVRLEGRLQRIQANQAQEKNQLWELYELTYAGAGEWRQPDLHLEEAEQQVSKLKQSIKALGQVNVQAVEEFAQLNERYTFMTGQQTDILQSKKDLNEVIRELTHSMREIFQQNFQQINANFQQTFVELFGGGRGEIILLNSDDVLTADIEIQVSPPGKKLQNMMLLSGGERCLTAIALLFAMLKLRPTPFCIMDEVEASLDDSNIFRFTDYINRYAEQSQFVVVTHRKGTMEAADRIYGVTMPEHGISKILSMKLGD